MTPELQLKIAGWRQKAVDGTLSVEDTREAILALRQGRVGAAIASDASRRKTAKKVVPSADDLLGELDGI